MESSAEPRAAPRMVKLPAKSESPDTPEDVLLRSRLKSWSEEAADQAWGPHFIFGGLGIIADSQIERIVGLARLGYLPDADALKAQLRWCYHAKYDNDVIAIIYEVYPTPPTPPPPPVKKKVPRSKTPTRAAAPTQSTFSCERPANITRVESQIQPIRACSFCGGTDHVESDSVQCLD